MGCFDVAHPCLLLYLLWYSNLPSMLEVVILLSQLGANFYFSDTALSQMLAKPSLADRFWEMSALSTVKIADSQVKVYQALQGQARTLAIYLRLSLRKHPFLLGLRRERGETDVFAGYFRLCYYYQNNSLCSVRRWSPAPWDGGYSYKFELNDIERHQIIWYWFSIPFIVVNRFFGSTSGTPSSNIPTADVEPIIRPDLLPCVVANPSKLEVLDPFNSLICVIKTQPHLRQLNPGKSQKVFKEGFA